MLERPFAASDWAGAGTDAFVREQLAERDGADAAGEMIQGSTS